MLLGNLHTCNSAKQIYEEIFTEKSRIFKLDYQTETSLLVKLNKISQKIIFVANSVFPTEHLVGKVDNKMSVQIKSQEN